MPLAPQTTLGVGGPARYYLEAERSEDAALALRWAEERAIGVTVLGGGSNALVADRGIDGLVLRAAMQGIEARLEGERVQVRAAAGGSWDALVAHAVAEGWAGLECLSGIPGQVGATPIQNVGAYGQEVAETIAQVTAIDRKTNAEVVLTAEECGLKYRDSVFKHAAKDRYLVTHVTFSLTQGGPPAVRYAELARHLAAEGRGDPSLVDVRQAVLELRRRKSMVLDPADENRRSAGSFFVNPTVDAQALLDVRERVAAAGVLSPGESMPEHPAESGRTKLSAAWLIDRAGFTKGSRDGAVGISTRHTLAIVNRGGATASELLRFATRVRDGVRARFGVCLVPEPVALGFAPAELGDLFQPSSPALDAPPETAS